MEPELPDGVNVNLDLSKKSVKNKSEIVSPMTIGEKAVSSIMICSSRRGVTATKRSLGTLNPKGLSDGELEPERARCQG